jgi:hypothetical protein
MAEEKETFKNKLNGTNFLFHKIYNEITKKIKIFRIPIQSNRKKKLFILDFSV